MVWDFSFGALLEKVGRKGKAVRRPRVFLSAEVSRVGLEVIYWRLHE